MKARYFLLAASLLCLAACGPKTFKLLSAEGIEVKDNNGSIVETTPTSVSLKNKGGSNGFAVYHATDDWTPYNALKWTAENKSDNPIALYVRLFENGKGNKHSFQKRYTLTPHSSRTITMDLPAPAPHPEVQEDFRLMKSNPYERLLQAQMSPIDYANIERVTFFNERAFVGSEWTISDIELIEGEKTVPDAMKLTADEFFPFIDKYGQFKYAEWPGKVHSDADLQKAREAEEKDLAANPGPTDRTKFGGWAKGPKFEATGHFRVQNIDGKWWMIDPEGYLFWSNGVVRVSHSCAVTPLQGKNLKNRCHYFEELPGPDSEFAQFYRTHDALLKPYYTARGIDSTYDFSSANLYRKYGKDYLNIFGDISHRRLRSWGLNTVANSSDKEICLMDRTPYTDRLEVVSEPIAGTSGWWPVMDPFDPSFTASVEKQLIDRKQEVEDPWCLGFFVDNEIQWGGPTHLAEVVLKTPPTQAAKKQFLSDLKKKYGTIAALNKAWKSNFASWDALLNNKADIKTTKENHDDFLTFNRSIIHKYYSNIRGAFDRLAPGLLYMGCRFAGGFNSDNVVISAGYCDVISVNRYAYTLDNLKLPEGVDKPIMIGEFHFGALDRGMFHASLIDVENQENRGEAYVRYVESALRHPQVIGVHWHQYSDQATTGRFDGEDFQVGFTTVCDTPYPKTVAALRKVGYGMYDYRNTH